MKIRGEIIGTGKRSSSGATNNVKAQVGVLIGEQATKYATAMLYAEVYGNESSLNVLKASIQDGFDIKYYCEDNPSIGVWGISVNEEHLESDTPAYRFHFSKNKNNPRIMQMQIASTIFESQDTAPYFYWAWLDSNNQAFANVTKDFLCHRFSLPVLDLNNRENEKIWLDFIWALDGILEVKSGLAGGRYLKIINNPDAILEIFAKVRSRKDA